jgi:sterol desaturase/sphingolipid hydroxylase (fatty acid hydroxylase superfamily)
MPPMDAAAALEPLVGVAVPATFAVAVALMIVEALALAALGRRPHRRSVRTSLVSGALDFGLLFVAGRLLYAGLLATLYRHRLLDAGLGPAAWLACFVGYDLSFYVGHRAGHEVRLLWCFHAVHHTTEEMRLTTAIRGSVLDFVYLPWFHAWLPLVGFHPAMVLVVESASRTFGVLQHVSPAIVGRLGWLDGWLATPSAHRVHHGIEREYLDRNYGEVLLVWDRLLGTFTREAAEPTYGVLTPVDPGSLVDVQLGPWRALVRDLRAASGWRARLRYLLDAPGWSERTDGRVRTLRRTGSPADPEPCPSRSAGA